MQRYFTAQTNVLCFHTIINTMLLPYNRLKQMVSYIKSDNFTILSVDTFFTYIYRIKNLPVLELRFYWNSLVLLNLLTFRCMCIVQPLSLFTVFGLRPKSHVFCINRYVQGHYHQHCCYESNHLHQEKLKFYLIYLPLPYLHN